MPSYRRETPAGDAGYQPCAGQGTVARLCAATKNPGSAAASNKGRTQRRIKDRCIDRTFRRYFAEWSTRVFKSVTEYETDMR
jgi:hypothetical protein